MVAVTTEAELVAAARAGGEVDAPRLDEADLRETDLAGLVLRGGSLAGADLRGVRLDRARISGTSLAGADLREADLTDAVLSGVDLSGARLAGATLGDTRFTGCRMIGTILRGLRGLTASFVLDDCSLQLADVRDVAMRGLRVADCDLSEADLSGADLRDVRFERCRLRGTVLRSPRLDGADLRGCDLGEVTPDTPPRAARGDRLPHPGERDLRGAGADGARAVDPGQPTERSTPPRRIASSICPAIHGSSSHSGPAAVSGPSRTTSAARQSGELPTPSAV